MPVTKFDVQERYRYQCGFNSYLESEAVPGALPVGQNSPQKPPLGLYAEKLSGTAFTAPRGENKQTWLYRILPSCGHPPFAAAAAAAAAEDLEGDERGDGKSGGKLLKELHSDKLQYLPNQIRWDPFELPSAGGAQEGDNGEEEEEEEEEGGGQCPDFASGLRPLGGAGDPRMKDGLGIYIYVVGRDMDERSAFYSADGDMLLVPQEGALDVRTEMGHLLVRPMEIAVLPRGVRFRVDLVGNDESGGGKGKRARGYILEIYHGHFNLPELGPIGSNGLANARDFQAPVARFDEEHGATAGSRDAHGEKTAGWTVTTKFNNTLFSTVQPFTPFDIVAWHGNYYPYKYDLGRFNTVGTISYDHPDPSIFTVLTASGSEKHGKGTALADFVIFPPRWLVGEDTFRPPYFHRNTMAEFMGLVGGEYDAKKGGKGGFVPGGASLHNVMSGHGPDGGTVEKARVVEEGGQKPQKVGEGGMAFMFETCLMLGVTNWGLERCKKVQGKYSEESWGGLKVYWKGTEGREVRSHLL
ncbi:homogentisate -dioxygenase [Zalerion maritima]|uniref:homogentisate 1,2-dioxygenase n=1 Tax=Zalerion maritima TaxID=339359 RepID=A0AAD5RPQ4_9PEZI|nr:homogentisate -dioxygenase [Zalerion maritima]